MIRWRFPAPGTLPDHDPLSQHSRSGGHRSPGARAGRRLHDPDRRDRRRQVDPGGRPGTVAGGARIVGPGADRCGAGGGGGDGGGRRRRRARAAPRGVGTGTEPGLRRRPGSSRPRPSGSSARGCWTSMASTSIRRCSIRRPISICSIATPTSGRCAARCGTPSRAGRTPGSGSSRRAPAPPPRSSGPRSWRCGFATSTRSTPWRARTRRWPPSGGCSPTPSASTAWRPRATRSCTTGTAPRWTSSTGCGGGWRSSRASTASSRRTSRRGTRCGPTSRSWRTRCGPAPAGRRRRPGQLPAVEERLAKLERLKRRYGPTLADVIAHRDGLRREREEREGETDVESLEAAASAAGERYAGLARTLSGRRRAAAGELARAVEGGLGELAMERTRFEVVFLEAAEGEAAWTDRGVDRVAFYFSANPGEDVRPLARIASAASSPASCWRCAR